MFIRFDLMVGGKDICLSVFDIHKRFWSFECLFRDRQESVTSNDHIGFVFDKPLQEAITCM